MEKDLEKRVVKDLKSIGCKVAKFIDQSEKGAPDRLTTTKHGITIYIELKSKNGIISIHQKKYQKKLKKRKSIVYNVWTLEQWVNLFPIIKDINENLKMKP